MKIRKLRIQSDNAVHISWSITGGKQSAYDLFLIQNGAVIERSKAESSAEGCILHTPILPPAEYSVLLTVTAGEKLATARTGFFGSNRCLLVDFG